ncbi:hypothetical protein ACSMXN_14415 [Jatrophihabitans sp. DSM 45814]
MLKDETLLNFASSRRGERDPVDARVLLERHGDLYRNHLAIAIWLSSERQVVRDRRFNPEYQSDVLEGQIETLAELADHLRRGEFLPSGELFKGLHARLEGTAQDSSHF